MKKKIGGGRVGGGGWVGGVQGGCERRNEDILKMQKKSGGRVGLGVGGGGVRVVVNEELNFL